MEGGHDTLTYMGRYVLNPPFLPFIKPRLILARDAEAGKMSGVIRWMGQSRKLKLVRKKAGNLTFLLPASPFELELVLQFGENNTLTGFLDTPLGHFHFTGRKLNGTSLRIPSESGSTGEIPSGFESSVYAASGFEPVNHFPSGFWLPYQESCGFPAPMQVGFSYIEQIGMPVPGLLPNDASTHASGFSEDISPPKRSLPLPASPSVSWPVVVRKALLKKERAETDFDLQWDAGEKAFLCSLFGQNMLGSLLRGRIGKHVAIPESVISSRTEDAFGPCTQWEIRYASPANPARTFTGYIRIHPGFTVFESLNHYQVDGKTEKHPFGYPYIGFPSFEGDAWEDNLSVLTFKRQTPFNHPIQWRGRVTDSLREGRNLPLIALNEQLDTFVLSPLNHLLQATVSIRQQPRQVSCGLPRAVHSVPQGTSCQTLLVYGKGVNATLDRWGSLLSEWHGTPPVPADADILLSHLSYWTNAGSAYWYNTFKRDTYEETLARLKAHHSSIGLRFGSYQLDSWWYKREHEGYTGGITEWEPRHAAARRNYNAILPKRKQPRSLPLFADDRMSRIQQVLDTPIGCHFKQISNDSVYVAREPDAFLCEDFAMPRTEEAAAGLFEEIFTHPRWRLAYVVHDWLQWMNDHHSAFRDLETGPAYFRALDRVLTGLSAKDNRCGHMTLQLCMTQPHMTLHAVSMKSVTSVRSTSDAYSFFVEGPRRWRWHLYSSRLIEALGKYAFYDNRSSGKRNGPFIRSHFQMEMIWLGLSCGPIGLGDPVGREKLRLIRRVIMEDGAIIKPDAPAKPLDRCFLLHPDSRNGQESATVCTSSAIPVDGRESVPYRIFYLLSINMHRRGKGSLLSFSLAEAGAVQKQTYAVWNMDTEHMEIKGGIDLLVMKMGGSRYRYQIAAPIHDGIAFLGDISKNVSAGRLLIQSMRQEPGHLVIHGRMAGNGPAQWVFHSERRVWEANLNGIHLPCRWNGSTLFLEADSQPASQPETSQQTGESGLYRLELYYEKEGGRHP